VTPRLYFLADAARMHGEIHHAKELNPEHTCLYEGDSERFLSAVAPWLFSLERGGAFAKWLSNHGHARSWGVILHFAEDSLQLYKHLRRHLIVQAEDGTDMYFRYYDPRVLRNYIPSCKSGALHDLFGPIRTFAAEDDEGMLVEYSLDDSGSLVVAPTERTLGEYLGVNEPSEALPTSTGQDEQPKGNWDFGY